jgi:hypothetical protein
VVTCRFGVRRQDESSSASHFEVFDRTTSAAVGWGMTRAEAEAEARRRNHDTSGSAAVTVWLGPAELAALRAAVDAYLTRAGHEHSRILEELYQLFTRESDRP